jgi:hypothetical protein
MTWDDMAESYANLGWERRGEETQIAEIARNRRHGKPRLFTREDTEGTEELPLCLERTGAEGPQESLTGAF